MILQVQKELLLDHRRSMLNGKKVSYIQICTDTVVTNLLFTVEFFNELSCLNYELNGTLSEDTTYLQRGIQCAC